ncbi:MAG: alpha/beta hydrolase family protein [Bacillota bacterium]
MKKITVVVFLISLFFFFNNFAMAIENSELSGRWEGEIDISGQKLGIIVKINENEENLSGTLDIPAQGVMGIPLGKINLENDEVLLTVPQLQGNVKFKGKLENRKISGEFEQSGYSFSFELEKVADKVEAKKERDYAIGSYEVEEKEIKIEIEDGKLAGTVAFPEKINKELPIVILVAGSGPTDRDGNNPLLNVEINTLKEIAHYLSSNGIMTFRYDKRGIRESSALMKSETDSFLKYRDDLMAIIDYFNSYEKVKNDEVYVLGHSEGSMLTIMAAERGVNMNALILVSGSGHTHGETLRTQITAIAEQYEDAGYKNIKKEMLVALDDMYEAVRNNSDFDIEDYNIPDKMKDTYLSIANQSKFAKDWLDIDPVNLLEKVNKPVCIIQGTTDGRVGVEDARLLASAVPDNRLQLHILEGVNHYLKKAETGNPAPDKRIDENLLKVIKNFVN